MALPTRKPNRLKTYDYSTNGLYFITICVADKRCLFGTVVGASSARPPYTELSDYGQIAASAILSISEHYPCVIVEKYVIMPNHIHLLLRIDNPDGRAMLAPTISRVIQQYKGIVTKQIGHSIWQRTFHDHIIRGEKDYQTIWQYIEDNPAKWTEDRYYRE